MHKMIHAAGLDSQHRLPHLYGIVIDDADFIIETREPPLATREKWMRQVDTCLKALHDAGIVWGDVKPENILVEKDDNAWTIDFGGGYTEGWIERNMAATMDGDVVGIAKVRKVILESDLEYHGHNRAHAGTVGGIDKP
ncbi:hypothetical protein S40288_08073 [Stachybotrys chartarum IBT 40288]|nr:hypothetical protein S40288_08073 [Stachybotrys chartarum IBT 40288]